ncbi:MAG: tail fiber protein [Deltaproteobacteria bacterium]|jgi:microcystin-dependent protein|nr:tail fiber protein [Deltaproteobacteria bacterium]MBK7068698.1 tail fiber protein [Deltaproteobacteria bacterium]MBK8693562.1 tail fiber protein [Deltaproteobacteria bacterium]MBP9105670.1 tail fiber protein [Gemmatimonadaceae bacterium]
MINEKHMMRGAIAALMVGMTVLGVRQTRADGIPGTSPMTYSGTLEEGGVPVTGMRNVRLTVFDDATATDGAHIRCTTVAAGTAVTNGRFQVTLGNECTSVVRSTPNLWLDVEVAGTSLGRTKISAVPFAVEAGRAAELTPAASNLLVPSGTVVAFAGDTAPAGWRLCDGAAVSQTEFPALFRAIGTAHGSGGAIGMFNLPDLRGRFVRGADRGAGRDPDRATRAAANPGGNAGDTVGSIQNPQVQAHAHGVNDPGHTHEQWNLHSGQNLPAGGFMYAGANTGALTGVRTTGITIQSTGGSETRPGNTALNYIIRL